MINSFEQWLSESTPQIGRVQAILAEPLTDIPGRITAQLCTVEAWGGRMNTLLSESNAWLDIAEHDALQKIDPELTVLERETILKNAVVQYRRYRDIIDGLCRAISTRISLGQSILRNATKEAGVHV